MSTYHLTPHESVTVVDHTPERLLVDVRYEPNGSAPPAHMHPEQDEAFEVVSGSIGVRLNGKTRVLIPGDVLEIPRGTPHAMWNAGTEPAHAHWATAKAGRTLEWFRLLDRHYRLHGRQPGLMAFAAYLQVYPDVFQVTGPARAFLGAMGRLARAHHMEVVTA